MSRIEELYAEYVTRKEYAAKCETESIRNERKKVKDLLATLKKDVDPDTFMGLDDSIVSYALSYEQNGFIMGFQYAIRLAKEVF